MQVKSKSALSERSESQKQLLQSNLVLLLIFFTLLFIVVYFLFFPEKDTLLVHKNISKFNLSPSPPGVALQAEPTPSPSPTPKPLTFSEMNALYGPCVSLPTLMYHHIQTKESALSNKQVSLTVYTDIFKSQMEYLKSKNYNVLSLNDLIGFFDSGEKIPSRSVLLTFDDGYQDFYSDAYPILRDLGFRSTMFVPTGLMENPDYLTWSEIAQMNGPVLFANHTWSHKSVVTQIPVMQKEISTADTQLSDHGYNSPKTFAYPYGPDNLIAENYLNSLGYKLAFTTRPGSILCKKQRLDLPRLRIGNSPLSNYGF